MIPFMRVRKLIDEKGQFESGKIDCAVFTSASTVKGFAAATPGLDDTKSSGSLYRKKQTEAEALRYGDENGSCKGTSIDSLVDLVIELKMQK